MVLGLTVIARFGATGGTAMGNDPWVFHEQLTKAEACAQSATRPATKASVRERELPSFDTCMARACHCDSSTGAGPCQFGPFITPGWTPASVRASSSRLRSRDAADKRRNARRLGRP